MKHLLDALEGFWDIARSLGSDANFDLFNNQSYVHDFLSGVKVLLVSFFLVFFFRNSRLKNVMPCWPHLAPLRRYYVAIIAFVYSLCLHPFAINSMR